MSKKEGYVHVGAMLRDELISDIDALGWEGEDKDRAAKIKAVLQLAAPAPRRLPDLGTRSRSRQGR